MHQRISRRRHSVLHQHADCHRPDASGNGSDERRLLLHPCTPNNRGQFAEGVPAVATFPGGQIGHSQRQRPDILTRLKMTSVNEGPLGLSAHLPSKSTSPMRRIFPVLGSWTRFMPTSMTAAPSLTILAVISPGTPSHRHRRETLGSQTCPGHASARSQLISEECAF